MATIINGDGIVTAEGTSTTQGRLRLAEDTDNGTNYVELQAPANVASNVTFTLPSADGTSGQVLQTNGSGALSFTTPASGSWVYLSTVTASNSATVDVESTFDSTYDTYVIVGVGVIPQTDSTNLFVRLKIGGSYATTNYYGHVTDMDSSSASYAGVISNNALQINSVLKQQGNDTGESGNLILYVYAPASTAVYKHVTWQASNIDGASGVNVTKYGSASNKSSTSALTGVRFYFSSGNVSSGTFRLYGIKNS